MINENQIIGRQMSDDLGTHQNNYVQTEIITPTYPNIGKKIENYSDISSETIIKISNMVQGETINKNKPWRQIIRRKVADGGSNNESI